jgi:hypothetical protein
MFSKGIITIFSYKTNEARTTPVLLFLICKDIKVKRGSYVKKS